VTHDYAPPNKTDGRKNMRPSFIRTMWAAAWRAVKVFASRGWLKFSRPTVMRVF
jgi:hypothetical protein